MLTRTHERGCCLTYDYVTDDDGLLLGEKDLDIISLLGGLVVSRPVNSSLSHKNALRSCVEHAKLWLENSDKAIDDAGEITYKGLRERLEKILASDYFTTSPEMKAAVEVAAAAGKYAPSNVAVQGSSVSSEVTVQTESDFAQYEQKDEETENFEGQEAGAEQSIPVEELSKDESEMANAVEIISDHKPEVDGEEQNMETKDHQYGQRRDYHNQRGGYRGGGGGRRGYPNGRGGGRGSRGGGYQNGRNQHYDQPGGYYPKNYYNTRGRGGRGPRGNAFNNHGSAQGGHAPADEGGS
ncbi:hypothetical protein IFM89_005422 [Coptis chinensis]|nr:hypothetical protein IFM89_005422 [Coptis chinensis]